MNNPLAVQQGGNHYRNKAIQPIEFAMANRLDPCAFSVVKYLTRYREKAGELDLRKAYHFIELRELLGRQSHRVTKWVIPMETYCRLNELPEAETNVLMMLERYVTFGGEIFAKLIKTEISALINATYSTKE